jgi:hypothetical protein
MEPQGMIDELVQVLREVHSEEELHKTLSTQLDALRDVYRRNRVAFSPEHIGFLKTVGRMDKAVLAFIELKEELEDVYDIADYTRLMGILGDIWIALRGFAVAKRVEKEMRGLCETLPALEKQGLVLEGMKISAKISQLEREAPNCRRGHRMIIRKGESEYFWGCSEFPHCFLTRKLARGEKDFLNA